MKYLVYFFLLISFQVFSQERLDSKSIKSISIPALENKNSLPKIKPEVKKQNFPNVNLNNPLTEPKPFYMNKKSDLLDAGEELQKKWDETKLKSSAKYDQYLGNFKTKSKYLGLQCRDFGRVDGDYVRIIVNDVVVRNSLRLLGGFKGVNIDLVEGLNRIDIIAINEGTASPNTGHFAVIDSQGATITSQKWNLFSSGKATMVILKEK